MTRTRCGCLRERPCCGACTSTDCWRRGRTSWITCWPCLPRTSWSAACRPSSSSSALPSPSTTPVSSSSSATSGEFSLPRFSIAPHPHSPLLQLQPRQGSCFSLYPFRYCTISDNAPIHAPRCTCYWGKHRLYRSRLTAQGSMQTSMLIRYLEPVDVLKCYSMTSSALCRCCSVSSRLIVPAKQNADLDMVVHFSISN